MGLDETFYLTRMHNKLIHSNKRKEHEYDAFVDPLISYENKSPWNLATGPENVAYITL